jgi:hypothetical protein
MKMHFAGFRRGVKKLTMTLFGVAIWFLSHFSQSWSLDQAGEGVNVPDGQYLPEAGSFARHFDIPRQIAR